MVQKRTFGKNKGNYKPSFNNPEKTTTFKKKKKPNKAELGFFTCGELGHFSKDCQNVQIAEGKVERLSMS